MGVREGKPQVEGLSQLKKPRCHVLPSKGGVTSPRGRQFLSGVSG
jgi:hypothetical protein